MNTGIIYTHPHAGSLLHTGEGTMYVVTRASNIKVNIIVEGGTSWNREHSLLCKWAEKTRDCCSHLFDNLWSRQAVSVNVNVANAGNLPARGNYYESTIALTTIQSSVDIINQLMFVSRLT